MAQARFIPLSRYREYPVAEMKQRAADFYAEVQRRRTVRRRRRGAKPPR